MSRVRSFLFLATLLVGCVLPSAVRAADAVAPSLLPDGTLGYLHVQVSELNGTVVGNFPAQLLGHVRDELAELTLKHFGLDVTHLTELTMIFPSFEQMAGDQGSQMPYVLAATFDARFKPDDVFSSLSDDWTTGQIGKASVVTNAGGITLYPASARTLLIGSQNAIQWWLQNRGQKGTSSLPSLLTESIGHGQIFLGLDLSLAPAEALEQLPPQAKVFASAGLACVTWNLSESFVTTVELGYPDSETAGKALQAANALRKQGSAILSFQEAEFERQVSADGATFDQSMEAVAALAFVRQAAAYLSDFEVTQNDAWLSADLTIEGDPSMAVVFGIAALGSAAQQGAPLPTLGDSLAGGQANESTEATEESTEATGDDSYEVAPTAEYEAETDDVE